jgi:predicted permease
MIEKGNGMSAFEVAFNAIIPIFLMIVLGYVAKMLGFIGTTFVNQASRFVFRISLPAMIFSKIASIDLSANFDSSQIHLMIFCAVTIFIGYIIAKLVGHAVIKKPFNERGYITGTFIQGAFRSNYLIVGYPVLLNLFGDAIVLNMALVTIIFILLVNTLAVIALTPPNQQTGLEKYKGMAMNLIKNPLIIAISLGFISALIGFDFHKDYPQFLVSFINMTGNLATPLGLLAIGAFFHFDGFKETLHYTLVASGVKLIILPIMMTVLAYVVGLEPMNVVLVGILFGGPTAVSSFSMSSEMEGDATLAGNIIIVSSALCVVSYMVIITFWLSALGLIG